MLPYIHGHPRTEARLARPPDQVRCQLELADAQPLDADLQYHLESCAGRVDRRHGGGPTLEPARVLRVLEGRRERKLIAVSEPADDLRPKVRNEIRAHVEEGHA